MASACQDKSEEDDGGEKHGMSKSHSLKPAVALEKGLVLVGF